MNENWPEKIWLQADGQTFEEAQPYLDSVTWCQDSVDSGDVEYIRRDLAALNESEGQSYESAHPRAFDDEREEVIANANVLRRDGRSEVRPDAVTGAAHPNHAAQSAAHAAPAEQGSEQWHILRALDNLIAWLEGDERPDKAPMKRGQAAEALRTIREHLVVSPHPQARWVPVEPTEAMIENGVTEFDKHIGAGRAGLRQKERLAYEIYRAMLAASPDAAQDQPGDVR
jgi:hypothetical protein